MRKRLVASARHWSRATVAVVTLFAQQFIVTHGLASAPIDSSYSAVKPVTLGTGGTSMISYQVEHAFNAVTGSPSETIPGVRVARSEFGADPGSWNDGGFIAAWLSPPKFFEFNPIGRVIQSAYF